MSKLVDFLLEIGTEELPALAARKAIGDLEKIARELLESHRLKFKEVRVFATPRRLAMLVEGLEEKQEDTIVEIKGPPANQLFDINGSYSLSVRSFAKKLGVPVESLYEKETSKGSYLFAVKREEGRSTSEVLKKILPFLIKSLHFEKSMRWQGKLRFIRPIRWLLALLGEQLISFQLDGLQSGNSTRGHRFLSRGEVKVKRPDKYFELLRKENVIVSQDERKELILKGLKDEAGEGEALINNDLLEEVVFLVENPWVIRCNFNEEYLSLPEAVIVEVLVSHQRCFPWLDEGRRLLPGFFCVSNGSVEAREIIKSGNEKVVKARLEDARFYYQEDLKKPLESRVDKLKGMVFQEKLGTLLDKTERNMKLSENLAQELNLSQSELTFLKKSAWLAKADLVTQMVREFPELQGIMGKEYALKSGEPYEVATAIYEHYLPRFPDDSLPHSKVGKILSLVDKIDTVVGYFLAGLSPTGSEDPYSLRRQAQGAVRIVLEGRLNLSLERLIEKSLALYQDQLSIFPEQSLIKSLKEFFCDRIERLWQKRGYSHFSIRSLKSRCLIQPLLADSLVEEIEKAQAKDWWGDILIAYFRIKNLAASGFGLEVDSSLLFESSEKVLYEEVVKANNTLEELIRNGDGESALILLASLRKTIDSFFDSVLVMTEDSKLRENRLKLLNLTVYLFERVADFFVFPKIL